jgi:DNA-binding PadR family transcriptional regulator
LSSTTNTQLRPLSYVVLALVGRGGASAHDLTRMVRQGAPVYWDGATSKVYAEPKRLARLGYLDAKPAPGRTRTRTVYTLTAAGTAALAERLAEPAPFPRIKNEAHLRLLAGDMIDDNTILESFRAMRPELDRLEALVDEMDAQAANVPHRARYLQLNHAYARRLVALHRDWIAEVERALDADTAADDAYEEHAKPGRSAPGNGVR